MTHDTLSGVFPFFDKWKFLSRRLFSSTHDTLSAVFCPNCYVCNLSAGIELKTCFLLHYKIKTFKVPNYLLIYKHDCLFFSITVYFWPVKYLERVISSIFTMKAGTCGKQEISLENYFKVLSLQNQINIYYIQFYIQFITLMCLYCIQLDFQILYIYIYIYIYTYVYSLLFSHISSDVKLYTLLIGDALLLRITYR